MTDVTLHESYFDFRDEAEGRLIVTPHTYSSMIDDSIERLKRMEHDDGRDWRIFDIERTYNFDGACWRVHYVRF